MKIQGSVRADLSGGTLDLYPLNHIIENTKTINLALSLKASVEIFETEDDFVEVNSLSFDQSLKLDSSKLTKSSFYVDGIFSQKAYGQLSFILFLISDFPMKNGLKFKIGSDAPPGSGLGGSSSLGVTLYKALCEHFEVSLSKEEVIQRVRNAEALVLNQGIPGYQDYYPALYGGILSLGVTRQQIEVEQLFSQELKNFLEKNVSLVYSNKNRLSGIHNWNVYKSFFDGEKEIKEAFVKINKISQNLEKAIRDHDFDKVLSLMIAEGKIRNSTFEGFLSPDMRKFVEDLESLNSDSGIKICGAGGGGCFLCIHQNKDEIEDLAKKYDFEILDFIVEGPLS